MRELSVRPRISIDKRPCVQEWSHSQLVYSDVNA